MSWRSGHLRRYQALHIVKSILATLLILLASSALGQEGQGRVAAPGTRLPDEGRAQRVAQAIGVLATAGLGSLLATALLKRADTRARDRHFFPDVEVGQRLGAPCGGGKIRSRSFGRSAKS
ncbi:MAG: hypothetical protein EAZ65_04725 [Verrucomicrobia bacterium]|nr:MAG: hypothetical protein EAZ84_13470 [Verrucomicrobiota bacterium]TAE88042.1 MAG: hypothetical protein EAZ82_05980 [Verrucomicrobiota bacterium]TAF26266.1 MAG: hypothetical protein EAZ71_05545 [Verrucomicrobiota bacterium]TAF41822.1 MAG: hypothetical protein EAZ65_04725 [Verrucomicrobiota bacterium]